VLWDLYPYHPLLLETIDEPFAHKKSVEKVLFGREGANVRILDPSGEVLNEEDGDYGAYPKIYQEYTPLLRDARDYHYQAGVFFAWEPAAWATAAAAPSSATRRSSWDTSLTKGGSGFTGLKDEQDFGGCGPGR
jgi:hypothetical protein